MARVLVVEDKDRNLELLVYLLQAFGHEPLVARDGREGLAVADRERPDLILMDLEMPRMTGREAAEHLRVNPDLCDIPLVAVTAYAMEGDREEILAAGFDGYITKPIDPETFVATLELYLKPRSGSATASGEE